MGLVETATHLDRTALVAAQSRDSTRSDRSQTHRAIIQTATQLYRRIGYRKTTVADIALEMSMSPANVYRFFRSKQAIEEAVAGELLDEVILAAFNAARCDGSAMERLKAVLQTIQRLHASRFASDSRLHKLVAFAMRENWAIAAAYIDSINSTVAQVISEGQASGELAQGDTMTLARCVLGATSTYLHPLAVPVCANCARPTLSQMVDFCIGALRAGGTATVSCSLMRGALHAG